METESMRKIRESLEHSVVSGQRFCLLQTNDFHEVVYIIEKAFPERKLCSLQDMLRKDEIKKIKHEYRLTHMSGTGLVEPVPWYAELKEDEIVFSSLDIPEKDIYELRKYMEYCEIEKTENFPVILYCPENERQQLFELSMESFDSKLRDPQRIMYIPEWLYESLSLVDIPPLSAEDRQLVISEHIKDINEEGLKFYTRNTSGLSESFICQLLSALTKEGQQKLYDRERFEAMLSCFIMKNTK